MDSKASAASFDEIRSLLLGRLAGERERVGLTQAELARRTGLSRMTIQRAEANGADTQLSTFVAYACAVGLTPALEDARSAGMAPTQELVHHSAGLGLTGEAHPWRSRRRIAAFDQAWRDLNERQQVAAALAPGLSQSQATAMATVVAWLGTDQGVELLREVLGAQGYDIVDSVALESVAVPRYRRLDSGTKAV